jgi:hypothetical protein
MKWPSHSAALGRYIVSLMLLVAPVGVSAAQQPGQAPADSAHRDLLSRYCIGCHNEKLRTAGLSLERESVENPAVNPVVWEKVIRKLNAGQMPPGGMPRPEKPAIRSLASYLEASLDSLADVPGDICTSRSERESHGGGSGIWRCRGTSRSRL